MAVIVDENIGRPLQHPRAVLHQTLRVIDHRMEDLVGIAPPPVQIFVRQSVTITVINRK